MAKALTAASVKKLRPTTVRREIPDALMPGLYLVVQPSGSKAWAVRYRYGRRTRKLTIGAYPAFDLGAARKKAGEALRAVADGADPARQKQVSKATAHLSNRDVFPEVAKLFIARHARPNNRSWKEAARLLGLRPSADDAEKFLLIKGGLANRWQDRLIKEISKRDVLEATDDLLDRGTGTLANRTLSQMRKLFNWAVERDIIGASPCASLKAPAIEESRDRILSDDEIRWLWKACDTQGFPFGQLAQVLLLTGQRRAEVAGMLATEISFPDRMWRLPKERTKNGEAHDVPLTDPVIAILKSLPRIAGRGLVFTTTGDTPVSGFSRAKAGLDELMVESSAPRTSIEPWILHDLRRTCASGMAALDVAPHVIEAVLNHKSGTIKGVAAVYNRHRYASEKRHALQSWACRVAEIVAEDGKVVLLRARGANAAKGMCL